MAYIVRLALLVREIPVWLTQRRHEEMKDLRCMCFTSKDAKEILVAGLQDVMFTINVDKGEIIKQVRSTFRM